ncbi:unnamed protein product, partial [Staurois parvus]
MRCPWYLFHRLFSVWERTQGPHDPLLPGGPMSCQSAPVFRPWEELMFFSGISGCYQVSSCLIERC